jgi:outer membrane protein assembly factor BamB
LNVPINATAINAKAINAKCSVCLLGLLVQVAVLPTFTWGQSWPTYRHDNRRSGVTTSELSFPLSETWVWKSPQPPQTAWTGPAKWDAYSGNEGLQSMRNFDPCFYVTADQSSVYFGSSVDDAAHALDAATGTERWVRFTGAAVRLPPTIDEERVYFGSDDGNVYCCDAASGQIVWQKFAAAGPNRIASNRKLISLWPVRTGVLVDQGTAVFAASLVPWQPSLLWSVDAASGEEIYQRSIAEVTLQGAILASQNLFYIPQGRAAPLAFARRDGQPRGAVGEAGGVFCILSDDEQLIAGPDSQKSAQDEIRIGSLDSQKSIASFSGTNRILIAGDFAWLAIDGKLKMLDRATYISAQQTLAEAKQQGVKLQITPQQFKQRMEAASQQLESVWKWEVDSPAPLELIKAGDALIIGLADEVVARRASDGAELWRAPVVGAAHGLAVANGRLFVSTAAGHIHAFESDR